MPKEYTREELVDKVIEQIQFPTLGKKSAKRNLMYVMTALGGTFIEVPEEEEEPA